MSVVNTTQLLKYKQIEFRQPTADPSNVPYLERSHRREGFSLLAVCATKNRICLSRLEHTVECLFFTLREVNTIPCHISLLKIRYSFVLESPTGKQGREEEVCRVLQEESGWRSILRWVPQDLWRATRGLRCGESKSSRLKSSAGAQLECEEPSTFASLVVGFPADLMYP